MPTALVAVLVRALKQLLAAVASVPVCLSVSLCVSVCVCPPPLLLVLEQVQDSVEGDQHDSAARA